MGWLFGKKKKTPQVPFPEASSTGEDTLKFPSSAPGDKVIEPEQVKEAVGFKRPIDLPEISIPNAPLKEQTPKLIQPKPMANIPSGYIQKGPLYVKVDVYQRVLGELDNLKTDIGTLNDAHRVLENSEFNEETSFEKLKKSMKVVHDRILQVDKTLFKVQGD